MRCIGLWLAVSAVLVAGQQTPFVSTAQPVTTASLSLVDLLTSSTNHTLLLRAFQRARLIPLLNRLNGSTLFAPTDEAIKLERKRESIQGLQQAHSKNRFGLWTYATEEFSLSDQVGENRDWDGVIAYDSLYPARDNLQLELRDTLLFHLLNYTLFPPPPPSPPSNITFTTSRHLPTGVVTLQETLYHPSLSSLNSSFPNPPTLPGSPPTDPEPEFPKREEGLLKGEGQKLHIVKKELKKGRTEIWIGGDWKGEGGIRVVPGSERQARNGAMVEIEEILQKPLDLATQIRENPQLSILASLLPTTILDYLSTAAHLTLFAPTNDAWTALSDLEMRYLQSGFADTDLLQIFGEGTSKDGAGSGKVGYLEYLVGDGHTEASVSTILGGKLVVAAAKGEGIEVNGTAIETGDIFAKNGVIHTVPSLLLPSGSLSLTAEKYLIALNATRFVSLLRSVNLSHYVQIPSGDVNALESLARPSYTILAPKDEVLTSSSVSDNWRWWNSLPEPGSKALKEVLEYHILKGKWTPGDLQDGMLLGTELRGDKLKGARQQLVVSVQTTDKPDDKDDPFRPRSRDKKPAKKPGIVGFGGASVIGEPVQVGDTIIYLLSSVLEPPASIVTTAVSDLRLSTFVASVYAASLDRVFSQAPAITYLVPENTAFSSLGLVMSYLLLPIARDELRSVLRYHAIDEIAYLDEFPSGGSMRYPTLDGAEIYIERSVLNSTLTVHGPTIAGHPANGETRDAHLLEGDILTATGVLHVIDQVELPPNLDIGINKLLKGAKASTMADLIRAANMSWILEGKSPPQSFLDGSDGNRLSSLGLNPGKGGGKKHKKKQPQRQAAKANRAYTLLCPTDKALSRLNLTVYLSDPFLLDELVRLHIIPTDAFAALDTDGRPITLLDEITYATLLDITEGGESKYGTLAFRNMGEDDWLVGIKSARGTNGLSDSARVVTYGRSSPWFIEDDSPPEDDPLGGVPRTLSGLKLAGGGGVLMIDSVLLPYHPGWWRVYGWIVSLVVLGIAISALVGLLAWKVWRGKQVVYERVEGQED